MAKLFNKGIIISLICMCTAHGVSAQSLRTSYFMDGVNMRMQLNPALQPMKGYINIPVLGCFEMGAYSNSIGIKNTSNIIDNNGDLDYDKLLDHLKQDNRLNLNVNTDILSFGWYRGKSFWSVNVGLHIDVGYSIPKSMFEYTHYSSERDYDRLFAKGAPDIRNFSLNVNGYSDIGVGYSRPINNKLTVGGRVKLLLGIANAELKLDELRMTPESNPYDSGYSSVLLRTKAHLYTSMHGMGLTENENGIIDDVDFDKFGIAGYGAAVDLGLAYKISNRITVSAAINDLGFISWSKSSTSYAEAISNRDLTWDEFTDISDEGEILNYDLMGLEIKDKKSRTTSLASTLVVGGEYMFANQKLSVGILSTTRFSKPKTQSEVTLSANYRPNNNFNATFSYSAIQTNGKSFGLGLKCGMLFLGTDYMFFGNGTNNVNLFLGMSIPLGKKRPSPDDL